MVTIQAASPQIALLETARPRIQDHVRPLLPLLPKSPSAEMTVNHCVATVHAKETTALSLSVLAIVASHQPVLLLPIVQSVTVLRVASVATVTQRHLNYALRA
jgi:hypothetical protein